MINVNPTRMELGKLKKRLVTARKGHKLLKDKRDEMVKQFLEIVKADRKLRKDVEGELSSVQNGYALAASLMPTPAMEEAIAFATSSIDLQVSSKNIMSVNTPVYKAEISKSESIYPYGFAFTSGDLDLSIQGISKLSSKLIELAQTEKTMFLLAAEIETTRRRVNALENVMIPELEETIKYITMKLDENERGNLSRLMKVKDMMIEKKIKGSEIKENA